MTYLVYSSAGDQHPSVEDGTFVDQVPTPFLPTHT